MIDAQRFDELQLVAEMRFEEIMDKFVKMWEGDRLVEDLVEVEEEVSYAEGEEGIGLQGGPGEVSEQVAPGEDQDRLYGEEGPDNL